MNHHHTLYCTVSCVNCADTNEAHHAGLPYHHHHSPLHSLVTTHRTCPTDTINTQHNPPDLSIVPKYSILLQDLGCQGILTGSVSLSIHQMCSISPSIHRHMRSMPTSIHRHINHAACSSLSTAPPRNHQAQITSMFTAMV